MQQANSVTVMPSLWKRIVLTLEMIRFEQRIAAEVEREPELGACFLEAGPRRMHRALADLLRREHARGTLKIDDAVLAAEHLASMCKGLADMERRFIGKADAEAADGLRTQPTLANVRLRALMILQLAAVVLGD